MPGPVSDSFDPEWGTSANGGLISDALRELHQDVSAVLQARRPIYILDLVEERDQRTEIISAELTEWQWRIIRFALERAGESI